MNAPIARLFVVFALLFGVLVVFTSRWTVLGRRRAARQPDEPAHAAGRAQDPPRPDPRRRRHGARPLGAQRRRDVLSRTYPAGGLFAHAVGYSFTRFGRAGLERSYNDELTGDDGELGSLVDELAGHRARGRRRATRRSTRPRSGPRISGLNGRKGAVVALDPRTGAVKAMASVPGFDPNDLPDGRLFTRLNRDDDNAPLLNRTTQSGYPPGSTFKVVTAIAAMDTGRYQPESTVNGAQRQADLRRAAEQLRRRGLRRHHADAGAHAIGEHRVGRGRREARQGDDEDATWTAWASASRSPSTCRPTSAAPAASSRTGGSSSRRTAPWTSGAWPSARTSCNVTPLQMAMVAAAVANGGRLMRPRLVDRVVDRDGRVVRPHRSPTSSRG